MIIDLLFVLDQIKLKHRSNHNNINGFFSINLMNTHLEKNLIFKIVKKINKFIVEPQQGPTPKSMLL